ncbi:Denitrification regulatory protein NirQ [Bacillus sp. THAF10]|uniref:gas vesicle protein GvpN n=1 Tax=Bacillus sp. THAF10 TaxID=2587848 RepID=UPI0012698509|nr:gas vesicle protein GvpN [Bacillus sp. THAF10]QFT90424.1 Denitrification regulatory protein NirQ [Bacillus sp. THAF10]
MEIQLEKELVSHKKIEELTDRTLDYLHNGFSVHFTGPTGVGKTSTAFHVAKSLGRPIVFLQGHEELSNADLLGDFNGYTKKLLVDNYIRSVMKKEETMKESFQEGLLLDAVKNGYTLIYDEFTRSKPETNNLFLAVMEEGVLPLYGSKHDEKWVKVHEDFSIIFTSNPAEYAGVHKTQDALMDRMITIELDYMEKEMETEIVVEQTGLSADDAKKIIQFVSALRDKCLSKGKQAPGIRAAIMIATILKQKEFTLSSKDENFKQLCMDVLLHPVHKGLEYKERSRTMSLITQEFKKAFGGSANGK